MRTDPIQGKLPLELGRDLRRHVMAQPVSDEAKSRICDAIDRETDLSRAIWGPFMMVDWVRYRAVSTWMRAHSGRALKGVSFWEKCVEAAERYDGHIEINRTVIARELEINPRDVSRMLGELVKCRGLIRDRVDGRYHYRLNRLVGTNLPEEERTPLQRLEPEVAGVSGRWPYTGPHAVDEEVAVSLHG